VNVALDYDIGLMRTDLALKGWNQSDLAKKAKVSAMAVSHFFNSPQRTARMAKRLATALGHDVSRYLIVRNTDSDAREAVNS
jgi:transcriptional regulator with XRE-family HTH domain